MSLYREINLAEKLLAMTERSFFEIDKELKKIKSNNPIIGNGLECPVENIKGFINQIDPIIDELHDKYNSILNELARLEG